jgi:chemotaxis protein methyltransferase CheR
MKGPFQAIFCRNVMIYFQRELQTALAKRYIDLIEPGGVLCIGHSESLPQGVFPVKLIAPATYQKVG